VKIGISAPRIVQITRKELLQSIKETNKEAAAAAIDVGELQKSLKNLKKTWNEL